jgi:hypothetical protein
VNDYRGDLERRMSIIEQSLFDPERGLFAQFSELKGVLRGINGTLKVLAWFVGIGIMIGTLWLGYLEVRGKIAKTDNPASISRGSAPNDAGVTEPKP